MTNEDNIIEVNEVDEVQSGELTVKAQASMEVQREVMNMEKLMEMSMMLAKSTIVPITYQNRPENCYVALDMASRMGVSPMMVMQNLYVIQGKPSFSGSAVGALLKASPQFRDVTLNYVGTEGKDDWGCYVSAVRVKDGKLLKGGTVTIAIAKREGWYTKAGSKWQTIPEIMLAYRSYSWFCRVYAPELMMGLQSTDEVEDVTPTQQKSGVKNPYEK